MNHFVASILCLFVAVSAVAQVDVTGVVVDGESGDGLHGASVIVKGADGKLKQFTTTKGRGEFSMLLSSVDDCRIIMLDRYPLAGGGSWTEVDNSLGQLPFSVRRVFYLYDVPADATRGGHSHYQAQELIVAMAGSFDVVLDDGKNPHRRFTLNRPYQGLYIPTGIWRTLENFSGGAVSTVLTSHPYSEPDYVREYSDFKALTNPK